MKTTFTPTTFACALLLAAVSSLFSVAAQAPSPKKNKTEASISITVKGIEGSKGKIRIGVHNEHNFLQEERDYSTSAAAKEGTITLTINNVEPGSYAFAILHDENEDGEMNFNAFKIPKEGYSFSKESASKFRAPRYEEAEIIVEEKANHFEVNMLYW